MRGYQNFPWAKSSLFAAIDQGGQREWWIIIQPVIDALGLIELIIDKLLNRFLAGSIHGSEL